MTPDSLRPTGCSRLHGWTHTGRIQGCGLSGMAWFVSVTDTVTVVSSFRVSTVCRSLPASAGVPSPLDAVRGGLVLGSEPLWEKVKGCVAKSRGRAETLWTRRADPTAFVTAIEDALPQASQLKLA